MVTKRMKMISRNEDLKSLSYFLNSGCFTVNMCYFQWRCEAFVHLELILCSPFPPQYVCVRVMLVDTYLDRAEPLLSVEGVHMLVKLSPPTDQRQLAHYLCIAER